jgi:hypothetical protein
MEQFNFLTMKELKPAKRMENDEDFCIYITKDGFLWMKLEKQIPKIFYRFGWRSTTISLSLYLSLLLLIF